MRLIPIRLFLKHYPIPAFALFGIFAGVFVRFALAEPEIASWIWFATLIFGGMPIVYKTIVGMFKGQFASDIVAMLAIVTAAFLGQAFAGAVVVLMQSGGEAIEAFGLRRASSSLASLLSRAPRTARRKIDGHMEEIDVDQVNIGDILIVRGGDLIPVDGTIVSGVAEIDESAITGEPFAKTKRKGDKLLSGSVDTDGAIEMRAEHRALESQYAKIVALVKKAQEEKAPIQRLADRYAIFFTPLALIMAAIGYLVTLEPSTILSVLVVATPCPLILATPLAVICGINRAADAGIIVKGGGALEQVASAKGVLFDKTGTITFGTPFIESVVSFSEESSEKILYYSAILEQMSSHSIAKAIVEKAGQKLPLPEHFHEIPGQGIEGDIEGRHYLIGSRRFLQERMGEKALNHRPEVEPYYLENKLVIYLVRDQECIGFLALSDKIRPGVPEMIQELHQLGVQEISMLTGDSIKNAEVIAKQAGIEHIEAELMPEQKADIVRRIEKLFSPLIMVGDGINDAPALATATVGIAMGAYGTAISAEAADIVFLVDDPTKVAESIVIGKRMLKIAKQSISIGMALSFVLMIVAIFGGIVPAVGALLQEIIDVAVILNALRARGEGCL